MPSDVCPTCGQPLPVHRQLISSADELVAAMRIPPPPIDNKNSRDETRDVYEEYANGRIPTGRFCLTFGADVRVLRKAIDEALRSGLIRQKYNDDSGYWCLA